MTQLTFPSKTTLAQDEEALVAEQLYEDVLAARKRFKAEDSTVADWKEYVERLEELFESDMLIFKPYAAQQAFGLAKYSEEAMAQADTMALMNNVVSVAETRKCFEIGYNIVRMSNPDYDEYHEAKERSIRNGE